MPTTIENAALASASTAGRPPNNAAGGASETYAYSPYGESANPVTGNPWRFTARYLDVETGLYYYRARYYAPRLGQFLQTDPIGSKDDPNLHQYVGLDPGNKTDPSGMTSCNGSRIKTARGSMCSGSDEDPGYAASKGNIYNPIYEKLRKQIGRDLAQALIIAQSGDDPSGVSARFQ